MVTIFIMSAKLASPVLFKLKEFQTKGYDVIIINYDVTSNILSRDSNYVVDVGMLLKVGNCSISMRDVFITSVL